jgi:hypothetical protein
MPETDDRPRPYRTPLERDSGPQRLAALRALSAPIGGLPAPALRQPPRVVERVFQNQPFEDYPLRVQEARAKASAAPEPPPRLWGPQQTGSSESYLDEAEAYLRSLYPHFADIPEISYRPGTERKRSELRVFDKARHRLESAGLGGQSWQLTKAFYGLCGLRKVFAREARREGATLLETVIPLRYLPEFLLAAPVWFIFGHLRNELEVILSLCDLLPPGPAALLFQIYNRECRGFGAFTGTDPIPLELAELVSESEYGFDFLVIATPYRDRAVADWKPKDSYRSPGFLPGGLPASYDPFLFGFISEVPEHMFLLGRWSGNGIFPLIGDMIASTLRHLRENRPRLNESWVGTHWWCKTLPLPAPQRLLSGEHLGRMEKLQAGELDQLVSDVLRHFKAGSLFAWLRGEHV